MHFIYFFGSALYSSSYITYIYIYTYEILIKVKTVSFLSFLDFFKILRFSDEGPIDIGGGFRGCPRKSCDFEKSNVALSLSLTQSHNIILFRFSEKGRVPDLKSVNS